MKQFLKFMLASMVGYLLITIIIIFISFGIIMSIASFASKEEVNVKENSLLKMELNHPIMDRTSDNPFENFDFAKFELQKQLGLNDILLNIEKAKSDPKIKGIFLDISIIPSGISTIEEIRNALESFKKSGKFIVTYSNFYTQSSYYLVSVADKIYLNPEGVLDFKGINAEVTFLKGLLEKLDIDAQVLKHGQYKSAAEAFSRKNLSDFNREQIKAYIDALWSHIIKSISIARNITPDELNLIADSLKIQNAQDALDHKLVDGLLYKDEFIDELKKMLEIEQEEEIALISIGKYHDVPPSEEKEFTKNKIAVVFASGSIVTGEGEEQSIGSEKYSRILRKIRQDSTIKAVVLRVNSGGGSALASDIIWREVDLLKKVKPIVVSMGDVAASGGYYISCAAHKIFADQTTLTGSIGVIGVVPNMKGFFNNKLGITFDNVKTNKYADFGSITRPLTNDEENILISEIDRIYQTFIEKVAQGRNLELDFVDSIGQGRIWSGVDALNLRLIDGFADLDSSIAIAANMAGIDNYRLHGFPKQKDPFHALFNNLEEKVMTNMIQKELGENYYYYKMINNIETIKGTQARMPFVIHLN